jgi:bis(5'-nucleosyl)-tetraphosphatase (symmetrical)
MATYVVGDIQGCLQPLRCVLEAVSFKAGRDTLWCVGDLVNRGPKSLKTLRFLYRMRDQLVAVLGNHDLHLLAVAAGVRKPGSSDTLDAILDAPDKDELLDWLASLPLVHREKDYTLVHAGIPPQWSVKQSLAFSREVESALQGRDKLAFLTNMYGNQPDCWSDDLAGTARLRVITNYFTRMRYCSADGTLDFKSKGPPLEKNDRSPSAMIPWFHHPGRKTAKDRILFGHWASLEGVTDDPRAIALDTGCIWGGALSLYHLDSGQWTRCRCEDGKCQKAHTS